MSRQAALLAGFAVFAGVAVAQPSRPQVIEAAVALGLTAEPLAAAGVHGAEMAVLLDRLVDNFSDFASHASYMTAASAARSAIFDANQKLRLDKDDVAAQQALATATSALASAIAAARQTRTNLIATLTDSLAGQQQVHAIFNYEAQWAAVPPAYRPAIAADDQAERLAWAIKMRDRAGASGLPAAAAAEISAAEAVVDVQLALIHVAQHSVANQAAMDSWAAGD